MGQIRGPKKSSNSQNVDMEVKKFNGSSIGQFWIKNLRTIIQDLKCKKLTNCRKDRLKSSRKLE